MIILKPKNVIFERFWPLSKLHFPASSTLDIIELFCPPHILKGQIATPNFENNFYGNDSDCTWEITTADNLNIAFEIAFLDLEPGPPFCPFDYIDVEKMIDGEWQTQIDPSFLWKRYCGAMRPMGYIETDSNKVS